MIRIGAGGTWNIMAGAMLLAMLVLLLCAGAPARQPDAACGVGNPRSEVAGNVRRPSLEGCLADTSTQVSEYIRCILQSADGMLWFGTNSDGVCRYDGMSWTFFGPKEGLAGRAVRGIVQDARANLWFATEGGVSRYDGRTFRTFTTDDGLGSNECWSLLIDRAGTLWVGTQGGVSRLRGSRFTPFPLPASRGKGPSRFSPMLVWSMLQDRAGDIWFGCEGGGAVRWDGRHFKTYSRGEELPHDNVRSIVQDRNADIWLGFWGGGLARYDGRSFHPVIDADGVVGTDVWTLFIDSRDRLWIGTLGRGACRFDGATFAVFRERHGVTKNHVQCIYEDRGGTIWLGFSGGLFRLRGEVLENVLRRKK